MQNRALYLVTFFYSASHPESWVLLDHNLKTCVLFVFLDLKHHVWGLSRFLSAAGQIQELDSYSRTTTPCGRCCLLEDHWTNWHSGRKSAFAQQWCVSYGPFWVINGLCSTGSTCLWIPRNPGTNRVNTALGVLLSHLLLHKSPVLPEAWQLLWISLQQRETVFFWKYFQPPHIFMKLPHSCFSAYISPDAI